ncbi:MAG: hypothetical protein ACK5LV_04315 [Lachnospirales bacterium]
MSNASNYLENKVLGECFGSGDRYIGLFLSNPTDFDAGVEVDQNGTGYIRQKVAFSSPKSEGDKQYIENTSEITFPLALADYGTVTHYGIYDSQNQGNLYIHGKLIRDVNITKDSKFIVLANNLKIYID